METTETKRFYTYDEAAEILGLKPITLRKAVSEKRLSCHKIGSRTVRFTWDDLEAYITHKPARAS